MDHPTYPLQHEQRAAIIMAGAHRGNQAEIDRIRMEFAKRRDAEFPGWRETYNREVEAWLVWHDRPAARPLIGERAA